jgi:hypothetical protein
MTHSKFVYQGDIMTSFPIGQKPNPQKVYPENNTPPLEVRSAGDWAKKIVLGGMRLCALPIVKPGEWIGKAIGGEHGAKRGAVAAGIIVPIGLTIGLSAVLGPAAIIFAVPAMLLMVASLHYVFKQNKSISELYDDIAQFFDSPPPTNNEKKSPLREEEGDDKLLDEVDEFNEEEINEDEKGIPTNSTV